MRALLAAFVVILPSWAQAAADASAIAVAPLAAPPDLGGISAVIAHQGAVEAAKHPGAHVLSPDDVAKALGAAGVKRLAACQFDAVCAAGELQATGAGRALIGTFDRDDVHYLVHIALIDVGTGKTIAAGERTVLIAGRTLEAEVAALLPELLAGKSQLPSKVTITSNAHHARATLDDAPLGEVPVTVPVSPGKHEVKVEKANYLPTTRFIDVGNGDKQTIAVQLTLLPNRVDPDADVPVNAAADKAAPAGDSGKGSGFPIASAVAAGVGAVALGVGIGFGVAAHNIQVAAVDTDGDGALNITRVQALTGQRDATIANVCYVGAGVAAAAAVALYFLVPGAASSGAPQAGLAPIPGGAAVSMAGSF